MTNSPVTFTSSTLQDVDAGDPLTVTCMPVVLLDSSHVGTRRRCPGIGFISISNDPFLLVDDATAALSPVKLLLEYAVS